MNAPLLYAKAIIAAIIAGLGALGTALADSHLDPAEVVGVLTAAVVAGSVVWRVPNADLAAPTEDAPPA